VIWARHDLHCLNAIPALCKERPNGR
jgi:hypothetical protein